MDNLKYRDESNKNTQLSDKLPGLSVVEINPTELCNRQCSFCPRVDHLIYPNRNLHLSVEIADTLVHQLIDAGYKGEIHITGFGEPLLNPNILEICKIFSNHFFTEVVTNGDKLVNQKIATDALARTGVSLVTVSAYDNERQVKQINNILKNSPLKYRIKKLFDTKEENLFENYNFTNRGGTIEYLKNSHNTSPCFLPFYKAFIDFNGDVLMCCNDWHRLQKPFGNIMNSNFAEIWNCDQFTHLRKNLLNGNRSQNSACANCNIHGSLIGALNVKHWQEQDVLL